MKMYSRAMIATTVLLLVVLQAMAQNKEVKGYQVENKKNGLLLRPYDANGAEGVPIVVYEKYAWRCLTWDLTPAGSNLYALRNYFTGKTFKASGTANGSGMEQVRINDSLSNQQWEFIPEENGYYRIQMPRTDKVLTVDGDGVNEKVKLMPWKRSDGQLWRLLPKPEKFTG